MSFGMVAPIDPPTWRSLTAFHGGRRRTTQRPLDHHTPLAETVNVTYR